MGKKVKKGKTRLDKYYQLAKQQGYRSRAAFKLIQLNRKFNFLSGARSCIDLCAAPGGWSQVAAKEMPMSSVIVAIDLDPIKPIPHVTTLIGDITAASCRADIKKQLQHWDADVVLHDGSPNVGTSWVQDAFSQNELVLSAFKLACQFLAVNGTFVTKVFRSGDYNSLLWVFGQLFSKVNATKPAASRNTSAEIFVVCQGYKHPDKIDPKFFDPQHVFKEIEAPPRHIDLFKPQGKRHRDGYENPGGSLYRSCNVIDFVGGNDAETVLATNHAILFNSEEMEQHHKDKIEDYLSNAATTAEIKDYCSDLQVLGKREFKQLLRWRKKLRDDNAVQERQERDQEGGSRSSEEIENGKEPAGGKEGVSAEEDVDGEIDRVMEERERDLKRKERRTRKEQQKLRERLGLSMITPSGIADEQEALFVAPDESEADRLRDAEVPDAVPYSSAADAAFLPAMSSFGGKSRTFQSADRDESREAGDDEMEEFLEAFHQSRTAKGKERLLRKAAEQEKKRERKLELLKRAEQAAFGLDNDAESENEEEKFSFSDNSSDSDAVDVDRDSGDEDDESEDESVEDSGEEDLKLREELISVLDELDRHIPGRDAEGNRSDDDSELSDDDDDESGEDDDSVLDSGEEESDVEADSDEEEHVVDEDGDSSEGESQDVDENEDVRHRVHEVMRDLHALRKDDGSEAGSRTVEEEEDALMADLFLLKANVVVMLEAVERRILVRRSQDEWVRLESGMTKKRKIGESDALEMDSGKKAKRMKRYMEKAGDSDSDDEDEKMNLDGVGSSSDESESELGNARGRREKRLARQRANEKASEVIAKMGGSGAMKPPSNKEELAEFKALAKKYYLEGKDSVLDSSFHRYAFDDPGPTWLMAEESKHSKPQKPVTKEEVDAFRLRLKEINSRSSKKVLEAKGRKKKRAMRKLGKERDKATSVLDNPDMSKAEKSKAVERLRKVGKGDNSKKKIKYVVSRKANAGKTTKGKEGALMKRVDRRMKSDSRSVRSKQHKEAQSKVRARKGHRGRAR